MKGLNDEVVGQNLENVLFCIIENLGCWVVTVWRIFQDVERDTRYSSLKEEG